MAMTFPSQDPDWILFKEKIGLWQERHIEKICAEYEDILASGADASERFWALEKRIEVDKRSTGVVVEDIRQPRMTVLLIDLLKEGVVTFDDLEEAGFSDGLLNNLELWLSPCAACS